MTRDPIFFGISCTLGYEYTRRMYAKVVQSSSRPVVQSSSRPVVHSVYSRMLYAVFAMGLGVVMSACNTSSGLTQESKLQGPTSQIVAPEVMPALSNLRIQSAVQSDLTEVFDSAQKVYPPKTFDGATTPNGYTITFFDFYSVSFAYVNQVSRATSSLDPVVLAARHNPKAKAPEEEKTWTDGTYVTGANTRRSTMGSYYYGFPILYGLYSAESRAKGFGITDVAKYIMPMGGYYWALTKSGRYFDLITRDWVDEITVKKFKQAYDGVLDIVANKTGQDAKMTANWTAFNNAALVRPGSCPTNAAASDCIASNTIMPANVSDLCMTRWFLWWSWWDCSSKQGDYTALTQTDPATIAKFTTIALEDNNQFLYQGFYSGCGPNAGKNLLKWWQTYGGITNALRPSGSGFSAEENTQIELMNYMGAYPSGNGRSINSSGCGGMQQYLTNNNVNLGVVCAEGWAFTGNWYQILYNAFSSNIPVAVSQGILLWGGQLVSGHVGIAKSFRTDPYGNLYVQVFKNPPPMPETWNLAEVFALSGTYYLYKP